MASHASQRCRLLCAFSTLAANFLNGCGNPHSIAVHWRKSRRITVAKPAFRRHGACALFNRGGQSGFSFNRP